MKKLFRSSIFRECISIIIVCVAIYFSSRALFHEGFFRTIDDISTVRIEHMERELKRGEWVSNFPVRYAAELSHKFGYFVYLFYAPLVYYVGALWMIVAHTSDIMATKFVYVLPLIFGPLLFYWGMRQKLDSLPSILATIIYTLFPFRGFDTYIRGGVGEAWAMAFFPAIVGSLFLFDKKSRWASVVLVPSLVCAIISHNISGLLIFGTTFIYGMVFLIKNKSFWFSLLLSLGISAFFWLPSIAYTNIVKVSETVDHNGLVTNYLVPLSNLLKPNFNYGIHDKTSPFLAYILIFGALISFIKVKSKGKLLWHYFLFWMIYGILLYLAMSTETKWLWTLTLPLSRNVQFPWRLLILLSTIIPLVFGLVAQLLKNTWIRICMLTIAIAMGVYFMVAFQPEKYSYYYNYNAEDTGPCATSWGEEYIPKWVKECISGPGEFILKMPKDGTYSVQKDSLLDTELTLTTEKGGYIEAQRYYFPGWQINIDNKPQVLDYTYYKHGTFRTTVDPGTHDIRVYWSKTTLMWIADIVTLTSLLLFIGVSIYEIHKKSSPA